MLIQMVCFFLMLVVVGGLISLPVLIDPHDAHRAPYPFAAFFAGLAASALVVIGGLVDKYISDTAGGVIIMLMAPTIGLLGGGLFGYRLGLRRRQRANDYIEPQSARRSA
jgi:hypothetical protein